MNTKCNLIADFSAAINDSETSRAELLAQQEREKAAQVHHIKGLYAQIMANTRTQSSQQLKELYRKFYSKKNRDSVTRSLETQIRKFWKEDDKNIGRVMWGDSKLGVYGLERLIERGPSCTAGVELMNYMVGRERKSFPEEDRCVELMKVWVQEAFCG